MGNRKCETPSFRNALQQGNIFAISGEMISTVRHKLANLCGWKEPERGPDYGLYLPQSVAFEINTDQGEIPQRYLSWLTVTGVNQHEGFRHGLQFYYTLKMMDGKPDMQTAFLRDYSTALLQTDDTCSEGMQNIIDKYLRKMPAPMVDAGKTFQVFKAGPHNFAYQIARQSTGSQTEETVPALLAYSGMIGFATTLRQQKQECPEGCMAVILDSHIDQQRDTYGFVIKYDDNGYTNVQPISNDSPANGDIGDRELIIIDDTRSTGQTLQRVVSFCEQSDLLPRARETRCAFFPGNDGIHKKEGAKM